MIDIDDDKREILFQQLQMVAAGNPADVCLAAVMDLMTAIIGFSSATYAEADAHIDEVTGDLKRAVRENWANTREMRSRIGLAEGAMPS
jgi:hypothetical protein